MRLNPNPNYDIFIEAIQRSDLDQVRALLPLVDPTEENNCALHWKI